MDFNEQCRMERGHILLRLGARYNRAPEKRQEIWKDTHPRIPLKVADALEQRRADLAFEEFSVAWTGRQGDQP